MATVVKARHANAKNKWTVRYMLDGKTKERSFQTKGEADDFKIEVEHGQRTSTFADPKLGKVDFVTYAGQWIDGLDRAPGTKKSYRSVLNSQIKPVLGGKSLAQVASDREAVWSLVSGMTIKGKLASRSRRSMALTVITGACTEAVRAGRIAKHRLDGLSIKTNGTKQAEIIPATNEQLEKLAEGLKPQLELTVYLMRGCGLRISEALAVSVNDFSADGATLRVHQQVQSSTSLGPLKARSEADGRTVMVPAWLWRKVQAHVTEYGTHDGGYLFGSEGRWVTYSGQHARFGRAVAGAGLPARFTEHHLRHLYASTLLANLVPITDVARMLGHRDINVTYATYSHLMPKTEELIRNTLESIAA